MNGDKPTYTYQVRTPDGMQTIQAKTMRAVSGCLGFSDGMGWIRLFAPGAWVSAIRAGEDTNQSEVHFEAKLPGMPGGSE